MFQTIIKPLPLIFTIATTFGVLVHDTQIDRAAVALTIPAAFASFIAIDTVLKSSEQHVHVEKVSIPHTVNSLRMNVPRLQVRDDDRRYVQSKKLFVSGGDSISLWPSV